MSGKQNTTLPPEIQAALENRFRAPRVQPDDTRAIPVSPEMRPTPQALARDQRAQRETKRFDDGDYEQQARRNKHRRGQAAKSAFHWAKMAVLVFGGILFVGLNIVWFMHVALPESCCRYLPKEDLSLIQYVIGAVWVGKLGMLLERYAQKHSDEE
jgi:hypothetical protein